MNEHMNHQMSCQEWENKILETDPDNLTDEELDMFNEHLASCPHCTAIIHDGQMNALLNQAFATQQLPEIILDFLDSDQEQTGMAAQSKLQPAHAQSAHSKSANRLNKVRRTIYIGLGGTGNEVVRQIKREALEHGIDTPLLQYYVLDTVPYNERPGMNLRNGEEYLNIGNYNPHEVLEDYKIESFIKRWWGDRNSSNTGRVDDEGGRTRAVGRMGFFLNFEKIERVLRHKIHTIMDEQTRAEEAERGFEATASACTVYIVFSLAGGTGSSLFLDVAYTLRKLLGHSLSEIVGMAFLPGPYLNLIASNLQQERVQANAYAALMELERLQIQALSNLKERSKAPVWHVEYTDGFIVSESRKPFDNLYLIDNINIMGERNTLKLLQAKLSHALFWLSNDALGSAFWKQLRNLPANMTADDMPLDLAREGEIPLYSALGISTITLDWHSERIATEVENLLLEQVLSQKLQDGNLPLQHYTAEMLITELEAGVNPFERKNKLSSNRTAIWTQSDIDNMLDAFTVEYNSALKDLPASQIWQYNKQKYLHRMQEEVGIFLHHMLSTYGPVAAYDALKRVQQHIETLSISMQKLQHEQQQTSIHCEKDLELLRKRETNTTFLQNLRLAFSTSKETANILKSRAHAAANLLYRWYDSSFHSLTYQDILQDILTPLDNFVIERIEALQDIEEAFKKRLENNRRAKHTVRVEPKLATLLVQPYRSEEEHLQTALKVQIVQIEDSVQRMLRTAFETQPTIKVIMAGKSQEHLQPFVDVQFERALHAQIDEILRKLRSQESLARRLREREVQNERQFFLQGAAWLWNLTEEARQQVAHMNAIHLLGYGVASSQSSATIEESIKTLIRNQPIHPELVRTDREDELVLLSTLHGLPLSALQTVSDLRFAYEAEMSKSHAPYLHLNDLPRSRQTTPLWKDSGLAVQQFLDEWDKLVDKTASNSDQAAMWKEVWIALKNFEMVCTRDQIEKILVTHADHPFFTLLDNLRDALFPFAVLAGSTEMTEQVRQALGKLADMEEMLFTQEWHKIEPRMFARFDPNYHHRHLEEGELQLQPYKEARIVNVVHPGYQRTLQDGSVQIRHAQVIVNIQARNPDQPVSEKTVS